MNADHMGTLGGGAAGLAVLSTVKWEMVPGGELVKVALGLVLIGLGVWLYRERG